MRAICEAAAHPAVILRMYEQGAYYGQVKTR